jgi:uncharacterized protein
MIFIDTGYLVAMLRPTDELHHRALTWSAAIQEKCLLTEYVLWEVMNQLSSPGERVFAHRMLAAIRADDSCEVVYASQEIFEAGVQLHQKRPDKAWSLTDCVSFHIMGQRGIIKALAYDHHFEQAGFDPLLRRDPHP